MTATPARSNGSATASPDYPVPDMVRILSRDGERCVLSLTVEGKTQFFTLTHRQVYQIIEDGLAAFRIREGRGSGVD